MKANLKGQTSSPASIQKAPKGAFCDFQLPSVSEGGKEEKLL